MQNFSQPKDISTRRCLCKTVRTFFILKTFLKVKTNDHLLFIHTELDGMRHSNHCCNLTYNCFEFLRISCYRAWTRTDQKRLLCSIRPRWEPTKARDTNPYFRESLARGGWKGRRRVPWNSWEIRRRVPWNSWESRRRGPWD